LSATDSHCDHIADLFAWSRERLVNMINGTHEWKLVAPWYRWERQFVHEGRKPWQTRPEFQKFDQNDFVKTFTQDPQRSLKFLPLEDTVFNTSLKDVVNVQGPFPPPPRFTKLYAPKKPSGALPDKAQEARMVPTGVRKLYLPTHKRFYLVVCELHCYVAGFPMVTPDQVCQAGFVVRRRATVIPPKNAKQAKKAGDKIFADINAIAADIGYWTETSPATGRKAKQRALDIKKAKANGTFNGILKNLEDQRAEQQKKLEQWRKDFDVISRLEGWIPHFIEQPGTEKRPIDNVGSWQQVEETPQQLKGEDFPRDEAFFPLFALFPDPNIPKHSARNRNIYFGVVPTTSLDTDQFGANRFDSDAAYEIRCFVRRHKAGCPRLDKSPDCHGELIWSERTEVYRHALATDLIGTANRPITIRMPDFAELAAQAAALPASKLAPVRVEQPQSMKFQIDGDGNPTGGGIGGFQICFFSIPLITIVAMFLLMLFLPIVVFLFGLFFLLALKFCIPPSLSAAGGLSAKLDVLMPKLELDASIDVDVEFDAALGLNFTAAELNADFKAGITAEHGIIDVDGQLNQFSNAAMLPIGEGIHEAKLLVGEDGKPKPEAGVDVTASVEYEPRVEVKVK
jgi:hypothetical protein